jgi:hypothetical protein
MPQYLFWQKGQGAGFFEVGSVSGEAFQRNHVGRGVAMADYDKDGDVDVLVVNYQEPPLLLRNDGGNRQNWLKVRLRPTRGNRNGFGARIIVETEAGRQYHEVGNQPSYLSQNALEAHFGLGKAGTVRRVEVSFLGGESRVVENVAANQTILVEE